MSIVQIAPLVRGAYLDRLGIPVAVTRVAGEDEVGYKLDVVPVPYDLPDGSGWAVSWVEAGTVDDLPAALAAAELPSQIGVVVGEEKYAFSVGTVGAPTPLPHGKDAAASAADARAGVVRGKVAIVTGGAQGFGAEIVKGLVASGAFVYIADLNGDGAAALAAELGPTTFPITVNVADEASVAAMAEQIAAITGGLDLVVSNAGVVRAGGVLEQDLSAFQLTTDINYTAFFLIVKHLGGLLAAQHRTAPAWLADIVQINSKSGLVGSNRNGAYAGSKFGGIGLVQSFALEMVDHGVKVNAICPGNFYDGPLWSDPDRGLFVQYLRSGKVPGAETVDDVREFYEAKVPLRRGTYGADVMRALYYLVEQEYETGQAVPVTGGQVMLSS
ncbi:SDR family NAD(P)-dependent oxidoreductase [Tessaracoccus sp.]|uniref:SDR family NAD(P)-dependent oxidoreductase n=1 Tax=Tessaracoccus sp. TaxID=1971211 RepID=UPI00261DBD68|nr:SDR family NAD(P)-dependent oxidoreductase [Tessaracoccus sp.]